MTRPARSLGFRTLVALLTALAPAAQSAAQTSAVERLTPQSVAAATVRLADLASLPALRNYPVEVLAAATEDFLGLPLDSIERVTVQADPPVGVTPQYAVVIDSTATVSFDRFRKEITEALTAGEIAGKPALLGPEDEPLVPCVCLLDEQTLAIGPRWYLKRLARGVDGSGSELAAAMQPSAGEKQHLHAAVMLGPLRPLIEVGLMAARKNPDVQPEAYKYLDGLLLLDRAVLTADFSGERESSLVVYADDREAGDRLESLLQEGVAYFSEQMERDGALAELRQHEEPVVRAWAAYCDRMAAQQADSVAALREGDDAFVLGRLRPGEAQSPMVTVAVAGIVVALVLPAVQAAREAARRNVSLNNIKQINLAWHNHHDQQGSFPAQAICADDGTPLLSWRVAILPYFGEQALFNRFRVDEPWDSPHNKPLLAEMPAVYSDPSSPKLEPAGGKTHYLGVAGPNATLTGESEGREFREFIDGTSNTVTIVQVDDDHAVPWTKPADFNLSAHGANPVGGIGSLHPGVFVADFADGHSQSIPLDTDPETLRALMSIDGKEVVELP